MLLRIDDRLSEETGEYVIASRPYTTNAGKDVHVRLRRVDNAEITMIRMYAVHEAHQCEARERQGRQALIQLLRAATCGDLLARSAEELARVASVTGQETALAASRRVVGLSPVIIAVGLLLLWLLVCTLACLLAVFGEKP